MAGIQVPKSVAPVIVPRYNVDIDFGYEIDSSSWRIGGEFAGEPKGVLLHSTRSSEPHSREDEYWGNCLYCITNVQQQAGSQWALGWNLTIGDFRYAKHIDPFHWGWNSRAYSSQYYAVEFAQTVMAMPITDGQVIAFCQGMNDQISLAWPNLYSRIVRGDGLWRALPEHWETPPGKIDGKSDVNLDKPGELANRIIKRFAAGW